MLLRWGERPEPVTRDIRLAQQLAKWQGSAAYADAVVRGGVNNDPQPLWAGLAIAEGISSSPLGCLVSRATTQAECSGFSVHSLDLPQCDPGMQVLYTRLGSRAWVSVPASAWLPAIGSIPVRIPLAWDFTNQLLTASLIGATMPVTLIWIGRGFTIRFDKHGILGWSQDQKPIAVIEI
jgi:hypothetical protein